MPVSIRRPITSNPVINSFGDLQESLRVADDLHDKCNDIREMLWRKHFLFAMLIVGHIVFLFWVLMSENPSIFLAVSVTVAGTLFIIGNWLPMRYRMVRELARNLRTLNELVDLLRGIEPQLANGSTLSFVEQATFRIRVARFDIGPQYDRPVAPIIPNPAPHEPEPVPVHDHHEAEQPSHS